MHDWERIATNDETYYHFRTVISWCLNCGAIKEETTYDTRWHNNFEGSENITYRFPGCPDELKVEPLCIHIEHGKEY